VVPTFVFSHAEDGIRDFHVTGVQTCALPICTAGGPPSRHPAILRDHRPAGSGLPALPLRPATLSADPPGLGTAGPAAETLPAADREKHLMNSSEHSLTDLSAPQTARIPGDLAMWCFILAELLAFLLLLGSMAFARGHWEQMFSAGIATLHPEAGLINTLILLSGSYFAARGV